MIRGDQSRVAVSFSAPFDPAHEFEPRGFAESDVPLDADVDVEVTLASFIGGIRATGSVRAPWHGTCRRCSAPVVGTLSARVNERFVEDPAPGDEEAYAIEGEFVDLLALVHDAVLLELPIAPLCRENCRGLCPICGADRNEEDCQCRPEVVPRWATLDALRIDDVASD